MNRPRRAFSGPLRAMVIVLIGAVALITVGPVLGRGFEPGSGPAVFITLPGAAANRASDGWIGAVSEALRALAGVRPAEPQPTEMPVVLELAQSEPDDDPVDAAPDQPPSEIAVADDDPAPLEPALAVFAVAALPLAPASAVDDPAEDDTTDDDEAAPTEPAIPSVSEPAPPSAARPRPAPTRAPLLPAGLGTPPPRLGPTPRPQQAIAVPTANRALPAASTPRPTAVAPRLLVRRSRSPLRDHARNGIGRRPARDAATAEC